MRNTSFNNSIANVIRFSVRVNEMLCALATRLQPWHLQPCVATCFVQTRRVGTVSGRIVTGHYRLSDSAIDARAFAMDIEGSLLPRLSKLKRGTDLTATPVLFQRLS